mmetsp:Transcript_4235/g.15776  ORF Transcript_4235/g.15776 Transcript_4235/m.15776 type:complete len:203 (-) Transcript_4235:1063-1671(-)
MCASSNMCFSSVIGMELISSAVRTPRLADVRSSTHVRMGVAAVDPTSLRCSILAAALARLGAAEIAEPFSCSHFHGSKTSRSHLAFGPLSIATSTALRSNATHAQSPLRWATACHSAHHSTPSSVSLILTGLDHRIASGTLWPRGALMNEESKHDHPLYSNLLPPPRPPRYLAVGSAMFCTPAASPRFLIPWFESPDASDSS